MTECIRENRRHLILSVLFVSSYMSHMTGQPTRRRANETNSNSERGRSRHRENKTHTRINEWYASRVVRSASLKLGMHIHIQSPVFVWALYPHLWHDPLYVCYTKTQTLQLRSVKKTMSTNFELSGSQKNLICAMLAFASVIRMTFFGRTPLELVISLDYYLFVRFGWEQEGWCA